MASLLDPDPPPELPPGLLGIGADDGRAEALGQLYRKVMTNPVGTEVAPLPGQQSVGMPGGDFDPLVAMGSNGQPITARQVEAARLLREQGQGVAMNTVLGMTGNAPAPGFRAFHGSPHSFERFDASKIGTGEGAQAYGHGLYLAENEAIARGYRDKLAPLGTLNAQGSTEAAGMAARALQNGTPEEAIAGLQERLTMPHILRGLEAGDASTLAFRDKVNHAISLIQKPGGQGHMYEVQVNADPAHFLDWDKPLSEQSPHVQGVLSGLGVPNRPHVTGESAYGHLAGDAYLSGVPHGVPAQQAATEKLREAGIPGIRYLDQGSRGAGEGTSNHVIFDAATMEILRKYGIAGLMAGGMGAGAAATYPQQ